MKFYYINDKIKIQYFQCLKFPLFYSKISS